MKKTNGLSGAWSIKRLSPQQRGCFGLSLPLESFGGGGMLGVYWLVVRREVCA
jgi:hypothetical protein